MQLVFMGSKIKATTGMKLRCKGWKQEAILRMLENNLENAEIPEESCAKLGLLQKDS